MHSALCLSVLSGSVVWADSGAEICGTARVALSRAVAGRTTSASRERHRARNFLVVGQVAMALVLLGLRGADDSNVRCDAKRASGIHGCADICRLMRIAIPDSLIAEPERVTRLQQSDSGQAGGDSGREVRGVRQRHAAGRIRGGLGRI